MEETINDIKNGNIKVFYNSDDFMNDLLNVTPHFYSLFPPAP